MKKLLSVMLCISIIFSCVSSASALEIDFSADNTETVQGEDTVNTDSSVEIYDDKYDSVDFEVFADELLDLLTDYEDQEESEAGVLSGQADVQFSSSQDNTEAEPLSTNRLIVKTSMEIDTMGAVAYVSGYDALHILQYESYEAFIEAYDYYSSLDGIEYVQEDGIVEESEIIEEDTVFTESTIWSSTQYQSDYFGYTDAKENMGTGEVVIAVIDSGVQYDHERLAGRVEPTGFDSINNVSCYDDRGHGTHVAGIIAANTRPNVIIKPYKVLDSSGEGTDTQVYLGIQAAIEDDVDIINLSLCKKGDSELLREVITEAYDAGITVVAAAGNNNDNVGTTTYTPSSFPEVICAVAIDTTRYKSDTSNWGSTKDLSAPGVSILSTYLNNTYKVMSGTSMAAPFISCAAAYLLADDSTLTPEGIYNQLYASTTRGGGTHNIRYVCPGELVRSTTTCSTPVFTLEAGEFAGYLNVEITCPTSGAEIVYCTSDMTSGTYYSYTSPIRIDDTTTITAYAICAGYKNSSTVSVTYTKSSIDASQFVVDENGVLTGYTGEDTVVSVPQYCNGGVVTGVASTAFSGNENITGVSFSKYVVSLEDGAFAGCTDLQSLNAASVTEVGASTFLGCENLKTLDLSAVTSIPAEMFMGFANLTTITFSALKSIGDMAFYGCTSLYNVSAPALATIGVSAFENSSVTSVTATYVSSVGERAFYKSSLTSMAFSYATYVGDYAFYGCKNLKSANLNMATSLGERTFEDCVSLQNVYISKLKAIPAYTFYNCTSLSSVSATAATSVGEYAFANCALTKLSLTALASASENAFYNCDDITSVTLKALKVFDPDIFNGCINIESFTLAGLTSIDTENYKISQYFPGLKTFAAANYTGTIPDYAFADCTLLSTFNFGKTTEVGMYAFKNTALTAVSCTTTTTVGLGAFNNIPTLTSITLNNLTSFSPRYFEGSENITSISVNSANLVDGYRMVDYLPNLTTFTAGTALRIPDYYFKDHQSITKVSADSAIAIGIEAFRNSTITKPYFKATEIGEKAFADCDNLVYVDLSKVTAIDTAIFEGSEHSIIEMGLYNVKNIYEDDYETFNFSKFTNLEFINLQSIPLIPKEAFKDCAALYGIYIDKVTLICENAFANCVSLKSVEIPLVTEIESGAFLNCTSLESFTADSLSTFDFDILKGCVNLKTLSFNSLLFLPVDENGNFALEGIDNLQSISADAVTAIPANFLNGYENLTNASFASAKSIGNYAFCGTGLTSFNFGENLLSVGKYAFAETDIQSVSSDYLEYVGDYAFNRCESLETVSLNLAEEIGEYAFADCANLTTIALNNITDSDNLPANAFEGCSGLSSITLETIPELPICDDGSSLVSNMENLSYFSANSVTEIPADYFVNNPKLANVEFLSLEVVGDRAFMNTALQEIEDSGVTSIGDYAFCNTELSYAEFSSLRTVGDYAFAENELLMDAMFACNVKLGVGAFENCSLLGTIRFSYPVDIPDKCFKNCASLNDLCHGVSGSLNIVITSVGNEAFYGCEALSVSEIDFTNLKSMGTDCFKGTFMSLFDECATLDLVLPKLKYIGEGAFNGITVYSIALENAETVLSLPECEYAVIGSDIEEFNIPCIEGTVYAPEGSVVEDYCTESDISFRKLNETDAYLKNVDYECVNHETEISFEAVGFDLTYQWYACNEDDRSDSALITDATANTFIPSAYFDVDGDEYKYRYYYCIATSVENGNVLQIRSSLCANTYVKVIGTDDTQVDYKAGVIYTDSTRNVNTDENIFSDLGANVKVTPCYIKGDVSSYGTGSTVTVYSEDGTEVIKEYTLVVYGDVNGDGVVDALDAQAIAAYSNGTYVIENRSYKMAADLDSSDSVTVEDYQAVVNKVVA